MSNFAQGYCDKFCPDGEAQLRIKEKVLHFFELKDGQKCVPGVLVKSFSRSAAGQKMPRRNELRTELALHRTVEYLLKDVVLDKRKPFFYVYDFIFDRLRAVCQETVIQRYNAHRSIKLLEPTVMFLAYSSYRLCEEPICNFDPKICEQNLQESLKRILRCYDEIKVGVLTANESRNRNFVEALYQMFNLGSTDALMRGIALPADNRMDPTFTLAFSIAMNYHQGNLFRVLRGIQELPHILSAIAVLKLPVIRCKLYEMLSHAYSSKQLTVPAGFVCRLAMHRCIKDLLFDCVYYNISADHHQHIHFHKSEFKSNIPILQARHEHFVEDKLSHMYIPEVLLFKRL